MLRKTSHGSDSSQKSNRWSALALVLTLLTVAALFVGGFAPSAEADDDSTSKTIWHLDIETFHPKLIRIGREPNIQNYWYVPFTLENPDDKEHSFFLEISAESDKGKTYRSLDEPIVLAAIKRTMGIKPVGRLWSQPEFTTRHEDQPRGGFPTSVALPKIQGKDKVPCVAIFHGPDREMDKLKITIKGLTNDVIVTKTDNPHERILSQRVLVLEYERPGDEFYAQEDPIVFIGRRWEMVETKVKTDLE
ncbi:MAG: hypothetical protein ACYTFT_05670 [Planctomycetota bacterium]|jgi:hypothetical protein